MMLEWVRFALSALALLSGLTFVCGGVFGSFRLQFALNRMHAAGMIDTLGLLLCSVGLMIAEGWSFTSLKLMAAVLFMWCTCPVSSHLIGRMVIATEKDLKKHMEVHVK